MQAYKLELITWLVFGDHLVVEFCINCPKVNVKPIKQRDLRHYSKESLIVKLNDVDWNINNDGVTQSFL